MAGVSSTAMVCAHGGAPGACPPGALVLLCHFCGRQTRAPEGPERGALIAVGDFRGPSRPPDPR